MSIKLYKKILTAKKFNQRRIIVNYSDYDVKDVNRTITILNNCGYNAQLAANPNFLRVTW